MPECAKAHLQQSRISKISGEDPRTCLQGKGGRRRRGKGREGGRGRIGKGWGQGREGGREGRNEGVVGREGRGRALDMGSAPLETSSGSAPAYLSICHDV